MTLHVPRTTWRHSYCHPHNSRKRFTILHMFHPYRQPRQMLFASCQTRNSKRAWYKQFNGGCHIPMLQMLLMRCNKKTTIPIVPRSKWFLESLVWTRLLLKSASIFVSLSHTSPLAPWHFSTTASIASLSLAVNLKEWVHTFSRRWSFNGSRRLTNKWLRRILRTSIHPPMPSYLISHSNDNGCYTWSIKYIPLSDIGYVTLRAPTTRSHFCGNSIHRLQ
mmetsp:Transcript_11345/g.20587  ORF Transcript_11345/g.20587 Transcript_11345/m.20587 type:complete len:220 (-) Transcript_11345:1142-1801(-)